jgi:rhomboid protease GluP
MPQHSEIIDVNTLNDADALAIAYKVFEQLGWPIMYAGTNKILGHTLPSAKGQQIVVGFDDTGFSAQSELINGALLDVMNSNKKNVGKFVTAFNSIKTTLPTDVIEKNKLALNNLINHTAITIDKEREEAEEVQAVLQKEGSNLYATYAIIALNILVFILMAVDGAGIMDLNSFVHIKWGSNVAPLTLTGDWWRLLTCTFIHFGIIHVGMNMYCLYSVGSYLEPMLGKVKYVTAYLCTGILASIVSLWWHKNGMSNSAGASGAVFGMYGLFLALLTSDIIPKQVRDALLKSIGIFIAYNLVYGMKGGVDNAAHIGGLISGFAIGYLIIFGIKKEKSGVVVKWIIPAVIVASIGICVVYLLINKGTEKDRKEMQESVKEGLSKDAQKYLTTYNEFVAIQSKAVEVLNDTASNISDEEKKQRISTISLPEWDKATLLVNAMTTMDVSNTQKEKAKSILTYINLRKEEASMYLNYLNNENGASEKVTEIRKQIDDIVTKLQP